MIKVKVLFFANFREVLGCSSIDIETEEGAKVADLCRMIEMKGERWRLIFNDVQSRVKIAVNQELTDLEHSLKNGDEVAFFPPVTGG